jgi:hypothetical protein
VGSTQRQREGQPAEQEQRQRGRGRGREWCPGVAAGGAGVLPPQKRCDWTGRRRKLADCGRPHASRGVALLDRGGPLRGGGGGRGAGTVAVDRSACTPQYGLGWGCAVRLRVRLRVRRMGINWAKPRRAARGVFFYTTPNSDHKKTSASTCQFNTHSIPASGPS